MPDYEENVLEATSGSENQALFNRLDIIEREKVRELEPGKIYATLDDRGLQIVDTDKYAHAPRGDTRKVTVLDAASFLDYWAAWASSEQAPEAWADPDARTVTGILDAVDIIDGGTGWGLHTVTLRPERTADWQAWAKQSGKLMPQVDFAEFLEDHLPQIVNPSGAEMLEVAQSLQGAVKAEWKQAHRLADGQIGLQCIETAAATAGQKGALQIPAEFQLVLAPFKGCEPYRVRFRYRLAGDQITLGYRLDRAADIEDAAWDDILDDLREGLGKQDVTARLWTGRP